MERARASTEWIMAAVEYNVHGIKCVCIRCVRPHAINVVEHWAHHLWIPCTFHTRWVAYSSSSAYFLQYTKCITFQLLLSRSSPQNSDGNWAYTSQDAPYVTLDVNNKCLLLSFGIMHWSGWYARKSYAHYLHCKIEQKLRPPDLLRSICIRKVWNRNM